MSDSIFQSSKLQRFNELVSQVRQAQSIRAKIAAIDQERKRLVKLEDESYLAKKNLRCLVQDAEWQIRINKADADDLIIARCKD